MSETYEKVDKEIVDPVYRLAKLAWVVYAVLIALVYFLGPCF